MASKKKCPECNGCMAAIWLMPDRFYFCEFCRVYYAGMDTDLQIVPNPHLAKHLQEKADAEEAGNIQQGLRGSDSSVEPMENEGETDNGNT